jgi:hypothetical protein
MNDNANFGFGKLVPGFDFLQNLAKGAAQSMPNLQNWVAPTLNVEELDKRISELKAVQFWLDQNGRALAATVQALEVQKMTLATLKGMNFSMEDMADALKLNPFGAAAASSPAAAPSEPAAAADDRKPAAKKTAKDGAGAGAGPAAGMVDPLQWWGALTQQFQEIAANAMTDVAQSAGDAVNSMTAAAQSNGAKQARAGKSAGRAPAKKAPAKKSAARKSSSRS